MASSQVGFASCLINRPSTPTTTILLKKNNNGYLHSCIGSTDSESENLKTHKDVDLSWLPNYDDNSSRNESHHHHHNGQDYFDDSWLPDHVGTKGKASITASKSFKSNRSRGTEDDSLLPSTSRNDDSWLPNYNDEKRSNSITSSKSSGSNRSRKTENGSDNSWLPTTSDVTKGNQIKKSKSNVHWKRAHDVVFSGEIQIQPMNKKLESLKSPGQVSPSKSENSVETDSLGGVSALLRRWKDLHETKNTNVKAKSSSGDNNQSSSSPAKVFDASEKTASSSTTAASVVHPESGKKSLSRTISCPIYKAGDVEKDKIRVTDIIKKQEKMTASHVAGNTNEIFGRKCNSWDRQQVPGDNKCFSHVKGKTHLIRGRHAINDFLNLMEQDKLRELEILASRKPVSQFPHRGRIRALLRFRFIRAEAESKSHNHKPSVSRTTDRREVEVKAINSRLQELKPITTNQSTQEAKDDNEITEFASPVEEIMDEAYDSDNSYHSIRSEESIYSDMISDENGLDDSIELENYHDWISEYSQSPNNWDEEKEDESLETQDYDENLHWISDVARPRSHWECLRQARYREMIHRCSYKEEIRELLERRCVASFLSSDMREKIDQLMVSQTQVVWQGEG